MANVFDTTKNNYAANQQFQQISNTANAMANAPDSSSLADPYGRTPFHTPWYMTTVQLMADKQEGISWNCNPSDISWSLPQRSTLVKTSTGTVLHVWPNRARGSFYDELKLTITMQSGNIIPRRNKRIKSRAPGLSNFYQFMQLYDSPKITTDGRANLVIIYYKSNLFPNLTLRGWFDSAGVRFNDSANEPNQVSSWSVDFVVVDTVPKLSNNQINILTSNSLSTYYDNSLPEIKHWS